jgi:pyruvate carboxylase subunit B
MDKNGWNYGKDDEELFELAMHPEQYRDYKSGKAREAFLADLKEKKEAAEAPTVVSKQPGAAPMAGISPSTMNVNVNGEVFVVSVSYDTTDGSAQNAPAASSAPLAMPQASSSEEGTPVASPLEGKFYLTKESGEKALKVGDKVQEGDLVGYIEAMKTYNAIRFDQGGKVQKICIDNGSEVEEDDVLVIVG